MTAGRVHFAIPGDLDRLTGGYAYDRQMIEQLEALGWTVDVLSLGDGFPLPGSAELEDAAARFAALPDGALVLVDGLAFGAMPRIAEEQAKRLRLVALVHHPLALEGGHDEATARRLRESECRALLAARCVVTTSRTTAATLEQDYAVPAERIVVAPPGTEPAAVSRNDGLPPIVLSVGSLTARKGQDRLVRALSNVADLDWRCRIVGSPRLDGTYAGHVADTVAEAYLGERIELVGEASDARDEMAGADLFALPSRHEGYGMVFAEAMSQGLPVIGCAVGAVPEVVPQEAGILVPPDDHAALEDALRRLLGDPALRRAKAAGALAAGARLPRWRQSAERLAGALAGVSA